MLYVVLGAMEEALLGIFVFKMAGAGECECGAGVL